VSKTGLARFRRAAWTALAVFVVGLAALSTGVVWLMTGGGGHLATTVGLFFAELTGLVVVAVYSTWRVLLR
jgi:hypothetical protein